MQKLGLIGWRGMVGSVLLERMRQEGDLKLVEPYFFSTSQAGENAPDAGEGVIQKERRLLDAYSLEALKAMDIIITAQGGDYTKEMHQKLRAAGWQGYWIDAASTLRMEQSARIILDPVNRDVIAQALNEGIRDFIGGNCTVSLLLVALCGLIRTGEVEWISTQTYQAASGAGAKHVRELLTQMGAAHACVAGALADPQSSVLDIERTVRLKLRAPDFPTANFGYPLAGSALPWIDRELDNGQSREEWKSQAEANKILGYAPGTLPIDGNCVRISSLRCHSQALLIKLRRHVPLEEIAGAIRGGNNFVRFIENHKEPTLQYLTPAAVAGALEVPIGRLRYTNMGDTYLSAFTVGDQLLWGAAEPLRCMLRQLLS